MVVLKGCQSITNEQLNEQELEYTRTTISPLQDQHVLSLLDEVVTGKRAKSSTHLFADFGNIDLTEAVKVVEHYDGTVRYTFEVDGFNGVFFENLIIKETKEGRLSGYLLRYEPDMQWLYEQQGNFNFDAFTGVLRVVNMDGSEVLQADFEGGKSTRFARTASKKAKANTEDCNNTQGGGSTGSGGNSGEGDDGTGGDSTGGGSTGGDSTDGGSTGGDSGSGSNGGDGSDGGGSDGCDWYVVDNTLIIEGCEVGGGLGDPGDDPANDDIVAKANTACEDGLGEFDEGECIDDDCPPDPVGVAGAGGLDLTLAVSLINLIEVKPHALISLSCEDLEKWAELANFKIDQKAIERLEELRLNQTIWSELIPYNSWDIQTLDEAKGATVNMDYFSVNITSLPNNMTAEQLLSIVRLNLNSFINNSLANFTPFGDQDGNMWFSDNPIGSIIHIDMGNNNKLLGGFNFVVQPDDGSVITSGFTSRYWRFSTIQAPGDFQHPVSGTREFGFTQNADGSYTFYTRGIDRTTGFLDNLMQENFNIAFEAADNLWSSFQEKIKNYINQNGGNAIVNDPVTKRPDWNKIREYLNGNIPIEEFDDCE